MARARREQLRPGDHISADRYGGLYRHHGIYVGKAKVGNPNKMEEEREIDDAVIHFLGPKRDGKPQCGRCFDMPQCNGVVISCLDCFLDGEPLYCSTCYVRPPDQVIETAFSFLEKKLDFGSYDLFTNNCEHFANYCKKGFGHYSEQVKTRAIIAGVAFALTGCTVS